MADFIWPFNPATAPWLGGPPEGTVTSEYGPRGGGAGTFHEGIDMAPGEGTPIPCAGNGIVERNDWHSAFGWLMIVFHGTFGTVDLRTLYAHREALTGPGVGGSIAQSAIIGTVGNTGGSFGAHLHFETHVSAVGSGIVWNTDDDGGYRTAINPRDFMTLYGDGGGPVDPTTRRHVSRRAWQDRPPTLFYRTW